MGFTIATGFCVKPHVPSSVSPPSPTSSSSAFVSSSPPKKQMRRRAASKLPQTCQLQSPNTVPPPSPPTDNKDDRSLWSNLTDFKNIRKLLFLLSTMGIAETSYLTLNKLFSSPGAICSTEGCLEVLSGPFSTFLGVPLTLFGGLAYSLFAYLCVWPLTANDEERESKDGSEATFEVIPADEIYASRDASTRPLMLGLSTILFIFSLYLMAVLYFIIQAMCPYCVFSAVLAAVIFTLTAFVGRAVPNWRVALGVGAVSTAIAGTAASVMFLVALPQQLRAQPPSEPQLPPAITMSSSSETMVSLNQQITKKGLPYCIVFF